MVQVQLDCPHCHTLKVAFEVRGYAHIPNTTGYIALVQCGNCSDGVVAKFDGQLDYWVNSGHGRVRLVDYYPREAAQAAPEHVPTNIASFYLQGRGGLARGHFDAAGSMFRKALDTALKAIHPEGKGVLAKRIDALPADKGVTPAMRSWAHEIRELGNDAAHDEDPFTKPEAEMLQAFTEVFLTHAFTLPGMIEARRHDPPE